MGWILLIIGLTLYLGYRLVLFIFNGLLAILPIKTANQIRNTIRFIVAAFLLLGILAFL